MLLVVLEEVDQLTKHDPESVCRLLSMTKGRGSRLMVVAISNELGLPAKQWSHLLRNGLDVRTVDFGAYRADQVC